MALWNLNELINGRIPSTVRDVAGVVGLTALGLAAAAFVVAACVVSRHPADDADNSTWAHLPRIFRATITSLWALAMVLLTIWLLPWAAAHSDNTYIKTGWNGRAW